MIEVSCKGQLLAMILRADFKAEGIRFFTPDTFSQQLGYMNRPKGYVIPPHDHNAVPRTIEWTQEVLIVRSGKVRLDLYEPVNREYIESHVLMPGDIYAQCPKCGNPEIEIRMGGLLTKMMSVFEKKD